MSRVSYESLSSVSSVDPDFPDMSGTPSLLYSASFGNLSFNGSLAASVPYERRQDRLPSLDLDQMALRATLRLRANEGVLSRAVSRQEVGHHDAQKKAAKLSAELSARKAEVEAAELRVKTARRGATDVNRHVEIAAAKVGSLAP